MIALGTTERLVTAVFRVLEKIDEYTDWRTHGFVRDAVNAPNGQTDADNDDMKSASLFPSSPPKVFFQYQYHCSTP